MPGLAAATPGRALSGRRGTHHWWPSPAGAACDPYRRPGMAGRWQRRSCITGQLLPRFAATGRRAWAYVARVPGDQLRRVRLSARAGRAGRDPDPPGVAGAIAATRDAVLLRHS